MADGHTRIAALLVGLAGLVIIVISVIALHQPSGTPATATHVPATPTPTVTPSQSATPTKGATPSSSASPEPQVQVVFPTAIAITVHGASGGTPGWLAWLGPLGGFLAGIGGLGALASFRRTQPATDTQEDK